MSKRLARTSETLNLADSRYSTYSETIADDICDRLAEGESLRSICREDGMPSISTVFYWLRKDYGEFRIKYARARAIQAETLADEILEIADSDEHDVFIEDGVAKVNHEAIQRAKLRIETRQWIASKLLPKKYGQKVDVDVSNPDGSLKQAPAIVQMITNMVSFDLGAPGTPARAALPEAGEPLVGEDD